MHNFAIEQVRDRRQSNVWMRTNVDFSGNAGFECDRTHVIEEDERADHAALCKWQNTSDFEAAKILATLFDHELDHLSSSAWPNIAVCGLRQKRPLHATGKQSESTSKPLCKGSPAE
jgi:hypothetical protein